MTSAIYDHSVAEDFRAEMDRALTFGIGLPSHAGAVQPPSAPPPMETITRKRGNSVAPSAIDGAASLADHLSHDAFWNRE